MRLTTTPRILLCACTLLFGCFQVTDPLAQSDASVAKGQGMGQPDGAAATGAGTGMGAGAAASSGAAAVGGGGVFWGAAGTTGTMVGPNNANCIYQKINGADACININSMDKSGVGCQAFVSSSGTVACVPDGWKCTASDKGDLSCFDASGVAGASGGFGTMGGVAGGTGGIADGGIPSMCSCDDGNACTIDVCDTGTSKCYHKSLATMTDADKDGVSDGCDCDDQNPSVYPGVTTFSESPFIFTGVGAPSSLMKGALSYDFDCDGRETPKYTALASTCSAWVSGQQICLGEGWADMKQLPQCGAGGAYQVCAFDTAKQACLPTIIMLQQSCR